ncbi:hypothetical protein EPN83_03285 [Patescibacteria group bacterium]|nr:MAG: hypothetical protein EPN83_03285 [Patescibacteria group bacterium]
MTVIAELLVALLGLAGFLLANYIRATKRRQTPLVCPIHGSCEVVVRSQFSALLGIPLEYWGMAYYSLITLAYFLFALSPTAAPAIVSYFILSLTATAFLFSLYLTAIQAVVLKHWCTWCLCSAALCTVIFSLVIYVSDLSLAALTGSWLSLF